MWQLEALLANRPKNETATIPCQNHRPLPVVPDHAVGGSTSRVTRPDSHPRRLGLQNIIGVQPAAAVASALKRRKAQTVSRFNFGAYPDIVEPPKRRRYAANEPPRPHEIQELENAGMSGSTLKSHNCRLRQVASLLRREAGASALTSDSALRDAHYNEKGMKLIGAALAAEGLSSGTNYISSWSSEISEANEITGFLQRKRQKINKTLLKYGGLSRQALELPVTALAGSDNLWSWEPLVPRGPVLPQATVLINTALMFRGLQARSLRSKSRLKKTRW